MGEALIAGPSLAEVVDPVDDPVWDRLARMHGSLFSAPPWLGAIVDTYGFEVEAWLTYDLAQNVTGGLPIVRLGEGEFSRLSVLPFSDYCNPIDLDDRAWPVLRSRLLASGLPFETRFLSDPIPGDDPMLQPVAAADLWHGIDLDPDEDRAWSALAGSARRAVRKARLSGIEVRATNDPDSLRAFYELHLTTRKHKYRLLAQPFGFFTALSDRFGDDLILLGAWAGDTLVAGILLLAWGATLYYKFNASSPAALETRPNDLLMWEATRLGVRRGHTTLDLGRTDSDHESLARYKAKYATTEKVITTARHGAYQRDPLVGRLLGPLTEILTRPEVPDTVTEEAGRLVYRQFA